MMTETGVVVQRGRGRPRNAEKDASIREATWHILAEKGYEGLTFEGVAERAGCSRATLYRRFASKLELVGTILDETSRAVEPDFLPDTSPRDALIAHATAAAAYLSGHRGQAIMRLGVMAVNSPELVKVLGIHAMNEKALYWRELVRICPAASVEDVEFAYNTLVGGVTYHIAMLQMMLPVRRVHQLVDQAIALLCDGKEEAGDS